MAKPSQNLNCALCGDLVYDAKTGTIVKNFRTDTFGNRKQTRCNQCIGMETRATKESKK